MQRFFYRLFITGPPFFSPGVVLCFRASFLPTSVAVLFTWTTVPLVPPTAVVLSQPTPALVSTHSPSRVLLFISTQCCAGFGASWLQKARLLPSFLFKASIYSAVTLSSPLYDHLSRLALGTFLSSLSFTRISLSFSISATIYTVHLASPPSQRTSLPSICLRH